MRTELSAYKSHIEHRIQQLQGILVSLEETIGKMDEVYREEGEIIEPQLPQIMFELPTGQDAVDRILRKRSGQFQTLVRFFVSRHNLPARVSDLATAVNTSKSAVSNILYRTQKEAFSSRDAPGGSRTKLWSLKKEVFDRAGELYDSETTQRG
jgi:hypothetical protein